MLSYRHGFHAGNSADVLKHLVLVALLRAMTRKETPLCYIETHAGAGRYDLRSEFAGVNSEHALGIARLIARLDGDAPELVTEYVAAIRAANTLDAPESLRWYPGSPSIARHWLRQADSLWLAELHPAEHAALVDLMASRAGAHVHKKDGYGLLKAVLPLPELPPIPLPVSSCLRRRMSPGARSPHPPPRSLSTTRRGPAFALRP